MSAAPARKGVLLALAAIVLAGMGGAGGYWLARKGSMDKPPSLAAPPPAGTAATDGSGRRVLYWYDPMVPTQKFDKPGKSPFMDMQLVPRYADEGGSDESGLAVSTRARQSLGLRTARVGKILQAQTAEAVGTIQFSERDISMLQARTGGFVERVYARAVGDVIGAGKPLVDVMNPDWAAAQQEYLAVRSLNDATLSAASRERLVLLGMSPALIRQVEERRRPVPVMTLVAPIAGVITELAVRQGMVLTPGMTVARINGLSQVWLELALPEAQAGVALPGQPAEVRLAAFPGQTFKGTVASVLPDANRETRTLRVRVELPNRDGLLRAGMSAQAILRGPSKEVLAVPAEAVIRTGRRALVYLSTGPGEFKPVEIGIGSERDGSLEVLSGLSAGQEVVASGQFLLDSEASMHGIQARRNEGESAGAGVAPPAKGSDATGHAHGHGAKP